MYGGKLLGSYVAHKIWKKLFSPYELWQTFVFSFVFVSIIQMRWHIHPPPQKKKKKREREREREREDESHLVSQNPIFHTTTLI